MTAYRYIGTDGAYLEGVPARDLEDSDVFYLDDAQRDALTASGLYEAVPAKPPKADKKGGD